MLLPDLESLRCFLLGAEHLNFRAAAQVAALSAPAFSDRIARLEDELGAKLFERTTRKVTLTTAGWRLKPHATRLLADARALTAIATDVDRAPELRLRVGTRFELGMSYLVPSLLDLETQRPGRTLDVVFGNGSELMRNLREERVDCVITSLRLTMPGLAYATLHEERYVLVAASKLAAHAPLNCPRDAAKLTLIDTMPNLPLFRYFLDAAPGQEAWTFAGVRHVGTIAAVRHLVRQQAGIAVLPRYFVRQDLEDESLVALMDHIEPNRDYFRLVWRANHALAPEFELLGRDLARLPLR